MNIISNLEDLIQFISSVFFTHYSNTELKSFWYKKPYNCSPKISRPTYAVRK